MWQIAIVICIITIYLYNRYTIASLKREMLAGFWVVDDTFKESSGIDEMIFWFGPEKGSSISGYIVLVVDGKEEYNDTVKMTYKGGTIHFNKVIHNIPQNLSVDIDIASGRMLLSNGDTLYAKLYRKNQESLLNVIEAPPDSEAV